MNPRNAMNVLSIATAATLLAASVASADTTSTFVFSPDSHAALDAAASFNDSPLGTSGALAIDPANPDHLFIANRNFPTPATGTPGGIYPFSLASRTRLQNTAGNIALTQTAVPGMNWVDDSDPYSVVVGADGSLFVAFDFTAQIVKISNPLSDAPTGTQIMGNYGGAGDDDPVTLKRVPAGFNASGYTTDDLLLFDNGINANNVNGVSVIHANGADGNNPATVWKRAAAGASGIRGDVNPIDGYAYFINTAPEVNSINGTNYVSLYRVKGDGVLQTIGLQLPAGVTMAQSDDVFAVNPADGSLWFLQLDPTSDSRVVLRVGIDSLTPAGTNQYLATATQEFTATGFNLGINSLTFSPDGAHMYAATPGGTDRIWAFSIAVPEPASVSLLTLATLPLLRRHRRSATR